MQLDYLWINDFRVLNNVEVNFSTQAQYSYDKELRQLSFISTPNPLKDFFGKNISEVTAFIGRNGVGKSTFFDFINRNLANHYEGFAEVYEDGNFIAVFDYIIYTKSTDLIANSKEYIDKGYKIFQEDNTFYLYYKEKSDNLSGRTDYGRLKYIYYSNVFDLNINYHDPANLIDISTNNLLRAESYTEKQTEEINIFYSNEIKRHIELIAQTGLTVPFKLPEEIFLSIEEQAIVYKHNITYKDLEEKGLKEIGDYIYSGFLRNYTKDFRSLLLKNLIEYRSYNKSELYKGIKADLLFSLESLDQIDIPTLSINQKEELKVLLSFLKEFDSLVTSSDFIILKDKDEENGNEIIKYKIRKDNSAFFSFLNSYKSIIGLDSFIKFHWRNLSSGEKAFFTLFSRLNYASNRINGENDHEIESIILMIDELDLYFHPEWQRKYLSILLEFIPQIFIDKKVQLLLSTHSPFITSDLPTQNIRFLEKRITEGKEVYEYCSFIERTDQNTFGANIYTLLADSFYMENGFAGEFAQRKINQLLDDLSQVRNDSSPIKNWDELFFKISMIGEPVIKEKLLELYNNQNQMISIEQQIKLKEEEIELLRKKMKK